MLILHVHEKFDLIWGEGPCFNILSPSDSNVHPVLKIIAIPEVLIKTTVISNRLTT